MQEIIYNAEFWVSFSAKDKWIIKDILYTILPLFFHSYVFISARVDPA